jgi:hypothetical protein
VIVTAVVCWVGYELNWIRQRQVFITEQQDRLRQLGRSDGRESPEMFVPGSVPAPFLLRAFGERGFALVQSTLVVPKIDKPLKEMPEVEWERERVHRLFPESKVVVAVTVESELNKASLQKDASAGPSRH